MKSALQWIIIVLLLGVYAAAAWDVLHPHVSPQYRAFFMDRISTEYDPPHYDSTPEEGMVFNRTGLPSWVLMTHGLSGREEWGRWSDENVAPTAGLTFARPFDGDLCLDFTARAVPWMAGQSVEVRLGGEERSFHVAGEGLSDYRLQFDHLHGAKELDFVLPPHLPTVRQRVPGSGDPRRVGINISTLRMVAGGCSAPAR
jgi:hypothetical protein